MGYRWIFGVAVVSAVAASTLIGGAAGASAVEVSPGVFCDRAGCHNDNDDTYRVDAEVVCSGMGGTARGTAWVTPHGDARINDGCPLVSGPGHWETPPPEVQPDGTWNQPPMRFVPDPPEPTYPTSYRYLGAEVDNNPPPPPTGSFGR